LENQAIRDEIGIVLDVFQDIVQVVFPDQMPDNLVVSLEFEAVQQACVRPESGRIFKGFLEVCGVWRQQ
jgi:hypothetical protein